VQQVGHPVYGDIGVRILPRQARVEGRALAQARAGQVRAFIGQQLAA
jgi:hypothetical protein